ncbi:MAG: serpin family protein [Lachnospiraceae bacterium]
MKIKNRKNLFKKAISLLLTVSMAVSLTACTEDEEPKTISDSDNTHVTKPSDADEMHAVDLMKDVESNGEEGKASDEAFITSGMELSLALFKASAGKTRDENVFISPLSIQLALVMTANGADGDTREEMETLLGGSLSIEDLNEYLCWYINNLPASGKCKINIANSIWFKNTDSALYVEPSFLQTNADYYNARIYEAPFDEQTLEDINNWVDSNTDGMIDKIIENIPEDAIMYLINAIAFDAEWASPYEENSILEDESFTSVSGEERKVEMMYSTESGYLNDGSATGFLKNYAGGNYSFAALLPNEDVDIYDYVEQLSAESLLDTLENCSYETIHTALPKFSYEYSLNMNDILMSLGMPLAFNPEKADFSALGKYDNGNIYIGNVLHKTFISVDGLGTKAGAATLIEMKCETTSIDEPEPKYVILDRPFVYMIIDNETNLPVFMGIVTDITE